MQLHTSAHEVPALSIPEVMEHLVPMRLVHLGMDEEARVPKLSDLLSQQLHPLHGVAEDDALVDLELGEEGIEAVHLLSLLHVGVVLRNTLQRKLIHKVDGVWRSQVFILDTQKNNSEGATTQKCSEAAEISIQAVSLGNV